MFYEIKHGNDFLQEMENDIKRFLFDNFDKLTIERVSIGGQNHSNNIFFYNKATSNGTLVLDFIGGIQNILVRYGCYTNCKVSLHGHYKSVFEKAVFKGVEFECVHYKLEKLDTDGYPIRNVQYFGRLNANEVPHEKLEGINKTLLTKHKSLLNKMRHMR